MQADANKIRNLAIDLAKSDHR